MSNQSDTPRLSKKEKPETINDRLFDLCRYQRSELLEAELITYEEYNFLMHDCPLAQGSGSPSPRRLESYDKIRDELTAARAEIAEWRILNGWGGTPEIINDFIKGQQTRIHHAQDLETELTAARAEIERLDTAGIHSCHDKCQRWTCVLRRELKAVTEQRDELLRYNEEFRNETLICADCDSISKEEYDRAIEQRDRLAEALRELLTTGDNGYGTPTDKAWEMAEQALAAVEGGSR